MGCGSSSAADPSNVEGDYDESGNYIATKDGRKNAPEDEGFFEAEEAQGQEFMAVKPWIGQIAEPAEHNEANADKPDETYALEYCYGYRSQDSRQNVYFNKDSQVTYMTAALGVILDTGSNTQKFFGGGEADDSRRKARGEMDCHNDDIMSLAMSCDGSFAVTGQRGSVPLIFVWDAVTGEKKQRAVLNKGAAGLKCVSISADMKRFAAVDMSNDHNVYVFDCESGNQMYKQKGDGNKIYDITFSGVSGDYKMCTVGSKHCKFWDFGGSRDERRGVYGTKYTNLSSTTHLVCASDANGTFYTGGTNGSIFIWKDHALDCVVEAHKGGFISAMRIKDDMLYTGGKDGSVKCWDYSGETLECKKTISFGSMIRAIDSKDGTLVIGTKDGCIQTCVAESEVKTTIMESHNDGEVWGLASMDENCVISSGDDNQVIAWDHTTRKCSKKWAVSSREVKAKRGGASSLAKGFSSQ